MGMRSISALRRTFAATLVVPLAGLGTFTSIATAHHGLDHEHCEPVTAREQSIVISAKKLTDSGAPAQPRPNASSTEENSLKPISKVSKLVPELAEPLEVAKVPTLADPLEVAREPSVVDEISTTNKQPEPEAEFVTMAEAEVISFHGITPGLSKRINVLRTWGDPRSEDTQADELKYRFDDLPSVWVRFKDNLVESIEVELAEPSSAVTLSRKLELQRIRPVVVQDSEGRDIAQVFPERGVTLNYATEELGLTIASDSNSEESDSPRIESILLQPIQAQSFHDRAMANVDRSYTNTIADLEAAIRLDGQLGEARATLAELHSKLGKAVTAERYAAEAVDVEPQQAKHRLKWAKCLRQLARYDRAVEEVRTVLETPDIQPLVRAKALHEMGLLAAFGSKKVARSSIKLHSKAIEIADELAVGDDRLTRLEAKALLVEAHLAVAVEISRGAWQKKDESVPQWIERASALAEAMIDEDDAYLGLRLKVAVSALAAAANLEKPINPLLWIEEAENTVDDIKTSIFDSLALNQYKWQLGLAYFHGSQIEHRRSEPESAIHLGELADEQLAELSLQRDEMPDTSYLMGRLYFQIGAVHAVHYDDHLTACQWYDEAIDRLLNPVPVTTVAVPQQHGDALVSMGVSYWSQDDRTRAIELTEAGVELIEAAVDAGLLEGETLMVSYNNLSAMHQAQGEQEPAARYEQLAKKITGTEVSQKPNSSGSRPKRR